MASSTTKNMLLRRGRYLLFSAFVLTCVVTIHLYRTRNSTTDFEDVGILKPLKPPTHAELLEDIPSKPTEESQVEDSQRELQLLPELYDVDFPDRKLPAVLRTAQHAELASRLHAFLSRPILSHAAAAAQNERQCPLRISDLMVNPDQLNGDGPFWRDEVDESMIIEKRADLISWLAQQASNGEEIVGGLQGGHSTRGIVVTGGNQDTTLRTLTLLRVLKRHKIRLPIEVVHFAGEMTDQKQRREVEELGATLVEVRGVNKAEGAWKNFQIKGLAITQSSFDQVLYLDSDNLALRDPTHLFDADIFRENGRAAFWPDLSKDHAHNAIWRVVGEDCTLDYFTFESGQIVIDKRGNGGLNLAALWLASGMMNDIAFWFKLCGGDKDTFRWAFRILGIPFGVAPRWMAPLGFVENGRFCGHTMLQYDLTIPEGFLEPPPLFVHSNLIKHLGSWGLGRGNTFTHVKNMAVDKDVEPTLNYAHLWVYQGNRRGMCTDLELHSTAAEDLSPEDLSRQHVVLRSLGELEGDPFWQFDELFWGSGGRVGGW